MVKKIILFDIDRTIFDTDKLLNLQYENISKIVNTHNVGDLKKFWESTLSGARHVTSEERIKLICSKFNIKNPKPLSDVYYDKEYTYIYSDSVYPETHAVLDKLKDSFIFGIYSEGTKKYQNHKFKNMGIVQYFDPNLVFIVDAKNTPEVVKKLPKDAVVVDDKESICEFLTKNGIKAIWLNKKDDRVSKNFETIHNLLELPSTL